MIHKCNQMPSLAECCWALAKSWWLQQKMTRNGSWMTQRLEPPEQLQLFEAHPTKTASSDISIHVCRRARICSQQGRPCFVAHVELLLNYITTFMVLFESIWVIQHTCPPTSWIGNNPFRPQWPAAKLQSRSVPSSTGPLFALRFHSAEPLYARRGTCRLA